MNDQKLRILIVIPGEEKGSSMIFSRNQVKDLRKEGLDVLTFFLSSRTSPFAIYSELQRLKSFIEFNKPDIVHSHYGTMTAFICSLASADLPLVITFHGSDLNMARGVGILRNYSGHLLSQLAAWSAKKIICVNGKLMSKLWWGKSKAVVLPMGIDVSAFHAMDRNECRKQLGLSLEKKYVFFNGSNPDVKRLDIALNTIELAKQADPMIEMLKMDGSTEPSLMPVYLNACHCLLLCSDSEGSPMVIKEALACELPIVSTDVGDVSERVKGVTNCFVVEQEPKALADAVTTVIRSDARSNGRTRLDEFSADHIAAKLKSIYQVLVRN